MTENFALVEFTEEDQIEVVPIVFLCDNDKCCYWPRKRIVNLQALLSSNKPIKDYSQYTKEKVDVICKKGSLHFTYYFISFVDKKSF